MDGVLRALGVRVRRVADLEEGALYLASDQLLLLDLELDDLEIRAALSGTLDLLNASMG